MRKLVLLLAVSALLPAQYDFHIFWPPVDWWDYSGSATTLDASGEYAAQILRVPKSGTITQVGFYVSTLTTAGDALVSLETVTTGGYPSGSMYGGSQQTTYNISATGWHWCTLSTGASATQGDLIAIAIRWSSGNYAIRYMSAAAIPFPYSAYSIGTPTKSGNRYPFALKYSDGTFGIWPGAVARGYAASVAVNLSTTPDEVGNKLRYPQPMLVVGVRANFYGGSTATGAFVLYDENDNVLASRSYVGGQESSGAIQQQGGLYYFQSPVLLKAGAWYRLVIKPDTAATSAYIRRILTEATGMINAYFQGNAMETSRTDGGSWTDTSDQVIDIWPIFKGVPVMGVSVGSSW